MIKLKNTKRMTRETRVENKKLSFVDKTIFII